jgi:hypothetical protein
MAVEIRSVLDGLGIAAKYEKTVGYGEKEASLCCQQPKDSLNFV